MPAQPKEANDIAGSRIVPVSHANTVHIANRFNTLRQRLSPSMPEEQCSAEKVLIDPRLIQRFFFKAQTSE